MAKNTNRIDRLFAKLLEKDYYAIIRILYIRQNIYFLIYLRSEAFIKIPLEIL